MQLFPNSAPFAQGFNVEVVKQGGVREALQLDRGVFFHGTVLEDPITSSVLAVVTNGTIQATIHTDGELFRVEPPSLKHHGIGKKPSRYVSPLFVLKTRIRSHIYDSINKSQIAKMHAF